MAWIHGGHEHEGGGEGDGVDGAGDGDPAVLEGPARLAEFKNIPVAKQLVIEMAPAQAGADADHQPLLNGIEILRTNAKEIRGQVAGR